MKRLWMTVLVILVFGCAKVENLGPVYHYPYTVLEYLDTDESTDFSLSAGISEGDKRIGMKLMILGEEKNQYVLRNYIPGRETIVSKGQCKDRTELREKFIRLRDKNEWEDAKVEIYKDYYKLCYPNDTLYMAKGWI